MRNKLYKIATATIALAITFTFSCSEEGTFKDPSDGKIYKTVKIGKQVWMAENLNYAAKGSKCYGNGGKVFVGWKEEEELIPITSTLSNDEIQANCAKYGRLYDWETAIKACPKGWHLPSKDEWKTLVDFAGGEEIAGKMLKAKSGWNDYEGKSGNGTDDYGFAALPGGGGDSDGYFGDVGNGGIWWSASEYDIDSAYRRHMNYDGERVYYNYYGKVYLFSVRCVQD